MTVWKFIRVLFGIRTAIGRDEAVLRAKEYWRRNNLWHGDNAAAYESFRGYFVRSNASGLGGHVWVVVDCQSGEIIKHGVVPR